jgi:hypothetical protein
MTVGIRYDVVDPQHRQWAISIQDPMLSRLLAWLQDNSAPHEIHAARVRFTLPTEQLRTQFYLQWINHCYPVEEPYPSVF